ncbi:MAG: protein-glutamate O-methyltransferase CheR [Candidatus Riflebacteria bacterium]|nr:protein-glutamate O-methyltransferase CheR [Candidatus Riflebacteria bacterium]
MSSNTVLSQDDFNKIRDLICERTGMYFDDRKLSFLEKRIQDRMKKLGIDTFFNYFFNIKFGENSTELQFLIDMITTNETYMFREYEQLESFANSCLPEVLKEKKTRGNNEIKIWSAGCSTGEEAYTLAVILRECLEDIDQWNVSIYATDIDTSVLKKCEAAIYSERSVKEMPTEYFARHIKIVPGGYMISPDTKKLVKPMHLNLMDRASMRGMRGFDFIFCRNVLIYFDDNGRKEVVDNFYNSLNHNGYIFLGHSESVGRITTAFRLKRMGGFLVYCKS